jgi:hypothetical protein
MDSTQTASLDIPELSEAASVAHFFPGMANHYFLSVGQMCKVGYYVTFRIDGVAIYNSTGKTILKGQRDLNTGLWRINLRPDKPQPAIAAANKIYELHSTRALVSYLHKAMFSPTKYALLQDVKRGHFTTWPGLTEEAINKHLKMTPVTEMGNMNQRHKNMRSTTTKKIMSDLEDETVTPAGLGTKTHLVDAVVIDQGQLFMDCWCPSRFCQEFPDSLNPI